MFWIPVVFSPKERELVSTCLFSVFSNPKGSTDSQPVQIERKRRDKIQERSSRGYGVQCSMMERVAGNKREEEGGSANESNTRPLILQHL